MEVALQWLKNARGVMSEIENTQQENITKAATVMADAIEKGHWVHTFGCGHATIPIQEMYPRIGGFTGIPDGTASANQSGSSKIRDWKEYDCVYAERCGLRECKLYRWHG